MDDIDWEYEAPRFVDFEANEHLQDNVDEYFNRNHESNSFQEEFVDCKDKIEEEPFKENQPSAVHFEDVKSSPAANAQDPLSSFPQTPSRETYGVKTPSRVLRSSVKKAKVVSSTSSVCDYPKTSPKVASSVEKIKRKSRTNIMTPSRLASWNASKAKFSHGKTDATNKKTAGRRSHVCSDATNSSSAPPAKKVKKNPSNVQLTSLKSGIPHSHSSRERHPTSEEQKLAEIKKMREKAKQVKEERKEVIKKLERQSASSQLNGGNKSHVTKTKEFHFKTDERAAKTHSMQTRSDADQPSDFQKKLRKYAPSPVKKSKTTVVKPFNLSSKRKHHEETASTSVPFVPMAKAIIDFHSRTPQRYRIAKSKSFTKQPVKPLHTTIPKTPNITKPKHRPVTVMSAAEREELEIEEMKQHQFKAHPVSSAVFNAPEPAAKVEKKLPTVPVEFHLSSGNHSAQPEPEVIKPQPFKAQPVPHFLYEKPGEKKKRSVEVTVPMSPAFALKKRLKTKVVADELNTEPVSFYHPAPDSANVFKPKIKSNHTEPEPFSFDVRDKVRFSKKDDKIKEFQEKEAVSVNFKAQGMPLFESPASSLPPKQTKKATKVEPFHLRAGERVALRVNEWEKQVEEEVKDMREKANFKANTDYKKVIDGKPWEPKLGQRPLTKAHNVVLHSQIRAKEREEFDKKIEDEMKEKENVLSKDKQRLEQIERKETIELRKNLVHKAQDIHKFKNVQVTKSKKPLTIPESPKFSTRFTK